MNGIDIQSCLDELIEKQRNPPRVNKSTTKEKLKNR